MVQEIINKPFEIVEPIGYNYFTKEIDKNNIKIDFKNINHIKHLFQEMVLNEIDKYCTLIKVEYSFNYFEKDFTTIMQVNLFYNESFEIHSESDTLTEIFCNQQDFACRCLSNFFAIIVFHFFGDYAKKYLENIQDTEYKYSNMFKVSKDHYNTALFYGGDNFDGFSITSTDE